MKYDKLFINGKIFTSDKGSPYAEAMAVKDGRIAWVGSDADTAALRSEAEDIIDLGGNRMLPGFVDCHMHAMMLADFATQISALPPAIDSIESLVSSIRNVREEQGPGKWIKAWGFDEGKLAEHRAPNRYDLDRGCSDAPVIVKRICVHICAVNSYVLDMAGITKDTPDPEGGKIGRDKNGEPDGLLYENARFLALDLLPEQTEEKMIEDFVSLGQLLLSLGLTTVSDMGENDFLSYKYIYPAAAAKRFKNRLAVYAAYDLIKELGDGALTEDPAFSSDSMFHISGVKLFGDGSVSGRTAWCSEPYLPVDDNDTDAEYGMPTCSEEEIKDALAFCKAHKCQLSIHVMGAKAIDRAVDLTWKEKNWMPDNIPAIRLEHVAMPTERAMKLAAASDMAWSTQPVFVYAEIESYLNNLPESTVKASYPVAKWLDMGIRTSLSSDAPATSWATPSDPFVNLKSAVTRKAWDGTDTGQEHRINIETAIRLYTAEAAPFVGFTDVGMLKPGYAADFIILDRDILDIPSDKIDQVQVLETWINGAKVYER